MGVYNLLSRKSFHGVGTGNVQECSLKSRIGKAGSFWAGVMCGLALRAEPFESRCRARISLCF
jgi:hypothetical protein